MYCAAIHRYYESNTMASYGSPNKCVKNKRDKTVIMPSHFACCLTLKGTTVSLFLACPQTKQKGAKDGQG